ncbi:MAG: MFS transporter [Anaerolineales bacterium]|nr:MFS transporter [Anaerolineales bacterium]MCB8962229.1 MFS transporter [Ardenticatenales bacterium]
MRELYEHPFFRAFYLPALLFSFALGLLIPVLPLYAASLTDSYGLIGIALSAEPLGRLIGDIPAGLLLRRYNPKHVMLLGISLFCVATAALFFAPGLIFMIIFRLMAGSGQAFYGISRHTFAAQAVRLTSRGRALSLLGGLSRGGQLLGPVLGGAIASQLGLRTAFLFSAAVMLVAIFLISRYMTSEMAAHEVDGVVKQKGGWQTLKPSLGGLFTAGSGQVFAQMIRAGRQALVPLYAAEVLGLDVAAVGLIESFAAGVDMSLFYPAGLIMDRHGRKWAIVPSFSLQALGMALIPFTGHLATFVGAVTLISVGNGLSSGSMMTMGADLAPPENRGEFLGLWRLVGDLGSSGGPLIVGGVAELLTLASTAWYVSATGLLAALIFYFFVPETRKHEPQPVKQPAD